MSQATMSETSWRTVTWAEVEDWAGLRAVERGRAYCREGRVARLALGGNGDLLAWVRGGSRYAVRIHLDAPPDRNLIRSGCTCPLLDPGCKHAVAALLAFLDGLRHGREIPHAEDELLWAVPEFEEVPTVLDSDADREREAIDTALRWPVRSACEAVLPRLRRLRELLIQGGREGEWDEYETQLRTDHCRRPRLLEVLDRLRSRRRVIPT